MERDYLDKHMYRFLKKVKIPNDIQSCWEWQSAKDKNGYGKFKVKIERKGIMVFRNIGAHVFIWEYYHGTKPKELIVLHECDNPSCVNPSHLKIGTYKDNSQDRDRKGRSNHAKGDKLSFPGERNGNHRLTTEQVNIIRERYAQGDITQQQLGDEYGVNQAHISYIVLKKGWK